MDGLLKLADITFTGSNHIPYASNGNGSVNATSNQTQQYSSGEGYMGMDLFLANYDGYSMFRFSKTETIVLICFYVPIFLIAFFGNFLVLIIVIPNRTLWGVTSNFLVNLALSDLLVAIVCIPMTVATEVYIPWVYGDFMCRATGYLQGLSVSASTFTLATMSLDRCLAIREPMKFRRIRTSSNVRKLLVITWILSAVIMAPLVFMRRTESPETIPGFSVTYCLEKWPDITARRIYNVGLLCLLYIIPGTLCIVCYALMGRRLWLPDKVLDSYKKQEPESVNDRHLVAGRRSLVRMLIAMASLFIACWMPYYIMLIYSDFVVPVGVDTATKALPFTVLLGHSNSAINPVLYGFMNKTFRRYSKKILTCKSPNRRAFRINANVPLFSKFSFSTKSMRTSFMSSLRPRRPRDKSTSSMCKAVSEPVLRNRRYNYGSVMLKSDQARTPVASLGNDQARTPVASLGNVTFSVNLDDINFEEETRTPSLVHHGNRTSNDMSLEIPSTIVEERSSAFIKSQSICFSPNIPDTECSGRYPDEIISNENALNLDKNIVRTCLYLDPSDSLTISHKNTPTNNGPTQWV